MDEHTQDGGPAFPFEYHNQTRSYQPGFFGTDPLPPDASQQFAGMTLRDYFAGQALAGIFANGGWDQVQCDGRAVAAYDMADAMLAERIK